MSFRAAAMRAGGCRRAEGGCRLLVRLVSGTPHPNAAGERRILERRPSRVGLVLYTRSVHLGRSLLRKARKQRAAQMTGKPRCT